MPSQTEFTFEKAGSKDRFSELEENLRFAEFDLYGLLDSGSSLKSSFSAFQNDYRKIIIDAFFKLAASGEQAGNRRERSSGYFSDPLQA